MGVLEKAEHNISKLGFALLLCAQLANSRNDIDAGLADDPVAVVSRLVAIELEKAREELAIDQLGNDWQLQDGFLSHFIADIFSQ